MHTHQECYWKSLREHARISLCTSDARSIIFSYPPSLIELRLCGLKAKKTSKKKTTATKTPGTAFWTSGVQSQQSNMGGFFNFRRAAFSSMLKSRVGNIMAKASALRVNLNLDGAPIASNSHTHPSHSQTSHLLTSSLSLGVPVPRPTQCMRGV